MFEVGPAEFVWVLFGFCLGFVSARCVLLFFYPETLSLQQCTELALPATSASLCLSVSPPASISRPLFGKFDGLLCVVSGDCRGVLSHRKGKQTYRYPRKLWCHTPHRTFFRNLLRMARGSSDTCMRLYHFWWPGFSPFLCNANNAAVPRII